MISQPEFKSTPDEFVSEAKRQVGLAREHDPTAQIAFKVTHIGFGLRGNPKLTTMYVEILRSVRCVDGITFVDACLGLLDEESASAIAPYVDKYNNNLERIQRPNQDWVTDKHSLIDKIETLRLAKKAGMGVCSGVLFGAGETIEDKVDILLLVRSLAEEGLIDSSPVNAFVPIYNADIEIIEKVAQDDLIRGLCVARMILPSHRFFPNAGRFRFGTFLPAMHAISDGYSSHHNYLTKFVDPATDALIQKMLHPPEIGSVGGY